MNPPLLDIQRFGCACLLGLGLGILYGALHPLRRHHRHIADALFSAGLFYAWLYLSFAVCRGDLRLAYACGLPLGCISEERTLGRLLRPVYSKIWSILAHFLSLIFLFFKKIFAKFEIFVNFLFATGKK